MRKNIFITFLALLIFLPAVEVRAQQSKSQTVYEQAEVQFNAGRFRETEQLLTKEIKSLKGLYKTSAYRLLALCELEDGDEQQASAYVELMLKADPYYTPTLKDPQRLVDLISEAKLRQQNAGITTASRQAESEDETPVPVTVITEDMIRLSGASTLQDVLCMYVPGISMVEGVEANIAMHGIYDLFQSKILFMQDGHRLNGSSTNGEAPDYRNSLDKIQQIEVLRGPASSLYGNVALTAVVNIITKKGGSMNGGQVSGVVGTQQTYGGSFVAGGGNNVMDIMGWGSINSTKGFRHTMKNSVGGTTDLYSGGYNQRPSYDVGLKARWKEFSMTVSSQRSKKCPYTNVLQLPSEQSLETDESGTYIASVQPSTPVYTNVSNFNIDRYKNIGGNGPGVTRTNHHINLDFAHDFDKISLQASVYMSLESTSLYNVMGDSITQSMGVALLSGLGGGSAIWQMFPDPAARRALLSIFVKTQGVYQIMNWDNFTMGGQVQATKDYSHFLGHGTAIVGAQYEHFSLTNGTLFLGGNYSSQQMTSSGDVFEEGSEQIVSGFAQIKHYFLDKLIFNVGLRYDHKRRFSDDVLNYFSPRASLIYKLNRRFSLRGSFNCSYVDAPYVYRACNVALFSGGSEMKPEKMNSLQLGVNYKTAKHLKAELNFFYNNLTNLVTQSSSRSFTATDAESQYLFKNAGKVKQGGADLSVQYSPERLFLSMNATWQKVFSSEKYNVYGSNRFGIPELMGKLVAACMLYKSSNNGSGFFSRGRFWVNATAHVQSKTYYQISDVVLTSAQGKFVGEFIKVNPQAVIGAGATYSWKGMELNLQVRNITNREYMMGSMLNAGIPHTGRQIIGKVTFKF